MRVACLIQKYFPSEDILHLIPNFKFSNHFIFNDKFNGLITSNKLDDYKNNYLHIDENKKEDILAMNIHHTLFENCDEKNMANLMVNLIKNIITYSDSHLH